MSERTSYTPCTFSWVDLATSDADAAKAFYGDQAPHWNSYVTVASADDAARSATQAGGTVVAGPFDVPGAHFALWGGSSDD